MSVPRSSARDLINDIVSAYGTDRSHRNEDASTLPTTRTKVRALISKTEAKSIYERLVELDKAAQRAYSRIDARKIAQLIFAELNTLESSSNLSNLAEKNNAVCIGVIKDFTQEKSLERSFKVTHYAEYLIKADPQYLSSLQKCLRTLYPLHFWISKLAKVSIIVALPAYALSWGIPSDMSEESPLLSYTLPRLILAACIVLNIATFSYIYYMDKVLGRELAKEHAS